MKALVYTGPYSMELEEREMPTPKRDEALIKIHACGICGSDIAGFTGKTGRRTPPLVMGHEFCGEVAAYGSDCKQSIPVGSRVVIQPKGFCGECDNCHEGYTNICEKNIPILGCINLDGAFEEYLCVEEKLLIPMPDTMLDRDGALVEPFAVGYGAACKLGDVTGKTVMIVGGGTIGLMILAVVKAKGAGKILVSDLNDKRLAVAKKMGADVCINPGKGDFAQAVAEATDGKMCDFALEAVGMGPTVQQAMASLKQHGTAVWVGNNRQMIEVNMQEIVTRQLTVLGSFIYTDQEFRDAMKFMHDHKLDMSQVVTREIPLEDAPAVFAELVKSQENDLKVVVEF